MLRRCFSSGLLVLALLFPVVAWPCAVCLTGAAANDPVADAFNWSVLFLMVAPYTIVGSIGGWLAYAHWRAAARRNGGPKREAPVARLAWIDKESGR